MTTHGRGRESMLYEVVCPAIYIIRTFGLAPYDFPRNNEPPKLQASNFHSLYTLFWCTYHSYFVLTTLVRFSQLEDAKTLLRFTEGAKLAINYLVSLLDLLMGIFNREVFMHIWNSIQLQQDMISFHQQQLLRKLKFRMWTFIGVGTLGWISVNQFGMFAFKENYLNNITYMIGYVATFVSVFKFCGLAFILKLGFSQLADAAAVDFEPASASQLLQNKIHIKVFDLIIINILILIN